MIYLNKIQIFRLFSSLFLIVRGHSGSMHANSKRGVIQIEYRYVQGSCMTYVCMYALALSLFVFWQDRCAISNEILLIQTKTLVFRQNLEFRSKCRVFQIHNFEILGFSHIWFEILVISSIIPSISKNLVRNFQYSLSILSSSAIVNYLCNRLLSVSFFCVMSRYLHSGRLCRWSKMPIAGSILKFQGVG